MVCYIKEHFPTPSYPFPPSPKATLAPLLAHHVDINFPSSKNMAVLPPLDLSLLSLFLDVPLCCVEEEVYLSFSSSPTTIHTGIPPVLPILPI